MWSQEQLKEIEHHASLFFGTEKLARIIGIPEQDLRLALSEPGNILGQAVHRGRLLREAEVREAVFRLALQGSGPAQAEALRIMKSMD